jgi:hypothetical protein
MHIPDCTRSKPKGQKAWDIQNIRFSSWHIHERRANPAGNHGIFFTREKSSGSNHDAPGGSAPVAMAIPDCDWAVVPVRNRGGISRSGNAGTSQCAPAIQRKAGLAQGEQSSIKKRVSPEQIFLN